MAHNLIFLGTPEFAEYHLEAIVSDPRYKVLAVVSQPDRPSGRKMQVQHSPVKKLALSLGLPVLTPETAKAPDFLAEIAKLKADAAVVVAYGQILSESFLNLFPQKVVNVHASLLPRWRGAAPIQRAIMAGDKISGVSLQVMVKALDAGAVIGEAVTDIEPDLTAVELHERLKNMGAGLLCHGLDLYLHGKVSPTPQEEGKVTYARKIEKAEAIVDWTLSAAEIYNRYRGLTLGPGTRTHLAGQSYKLTDIEAVGDSVKGAVPGEVIEVGSEFLLVQSGEGAIRINEIQPESRARLKVAEFLRGYEMKEGICFE